MKSLALRLLQLYKRWISPAFPAACRYVPTCSEYAMEAVERYGALRGVIMATWRVLRCHPLAKGGYDPVVEVGLDALVKAAAENPAHSQKAPENPVPEGRSPIAQRFSAGKTRQNDPSPAGTTDSAVPAYNL
jgi:uncharacterized protein